MPGREIDRRRVVRRDGQAPRLRGRLKAPPWRRRRRRRVTGTCGTGRRGPYRQRQCLLIEEVGGDDCGEHGHERDSDHGVGHTDGAPRQTRREHVPQPDETQSSALFLPLSRSVSRGSFRRCNRHSCMQGLADGREARNRNAADHLCAIGPSS